MHSPARSRFNTLLDLIDPCSNAVNVSLKVFASLSKIQNRVHIFERVRCERLKLILNRSLWVKMAVIDHTVGRKAQVVK